MLGKPCSFPSKAATWNRWLGYKSGSAKRIKFNKRCCGHGASEFKTLLIRGREPIADASEILEKSALQKYKSQNRAQHVYRAAARLWALGVAWSESLQIVNDAFDACILKD